VGGEATWKTSDFEQATDRYDIAFAKGVRDLVVGSGIVLEDRGTHALKGLDEPWHLFAAG
jgi:class 3 adenylate cyclase